MRTTRTRLIAAALAAALVVIPASEAFARGGFRGGGFRTPSFRSLGTSRPLGASRPLSGWGSATRPSLNASPATPRLGGISGNRSGVAAQRGLYDSAKRNGTLFSSKTEASQAFKSRYSKDYASTFASEPAVRPSYIPNSAVVGGRDVNIVYNPGLGGYGYLHPGLGTWMLFDALADAAMLDHAMSNRGYYWGGAPVYVSHGPGFFSLAFGVLAFLIIASALVRVVRRRQERQE